jgi:putative hemolysin
MMLAIVIAAVLACVVVQAFFAASEIALVSADELKVRAESERGSRRSSILIRLLGDRDRVVALTLTGANLATVIAAVMLTSFLHQYGPHAAFLAPFILTPITLLLGEAIPKLLTLRDPDRFVSLAVRPLRVMSMTLAPVLGLETWLSRALRRLMGVPPEMRSVFLSREDLLRLARRTESTDAPGADAIEPAERQMITRIFRFSRADLRKVMVPLVRVEAIPEETTLAATIETVRREGFTRIPVFSRRITDIEGVVHVFDLLEAQDLTRSVKAIMRHVSYFPESMPLDEALVAMQRTGENMAVVVDEYGGSSGIVTLEDLLEEIVGEIEDEHDLAEEHSRIAGPRSLLAIAHASVSELNERYGLKLPEGDEYATIGGLVVERLGHIPKPGEQLQVGDITITVTRSDPRAVGEVALLLPLPLKPELLKRR